MNYRMILIVLLAGISTSGCQSTPPQAEPVVVETRPVQIILTGNEAITVVEKGGVINTDTVHRTVKSMSENSPGLNVVQDEGLASKLSSWLDKPDAANLAGYLDKPVVKQKLELHHLKYMVVVEHDWWGVEAQVWNLHNRKLDGVINAKALVSSSKTHCSKDAGTWIVGTGATMIYIPYATTMMAALTTRSMLGNYSVRITNFLNPEGTDTAQVEPYLSISETVVQNGSKAVGNIPIPCESINTLSSNPRIDSTRLGIYLAWKINKYPAVAGN